MMPIDSCTGCDETKLSSKADTYYVNPHTGKDKASGLSPERAWKTLQPVQDLLGTPEYRGGVKVCLWHKAKFRQGVDGPVASARLTIRAHGSKNYPIEILSYDEHGPLYDARDGDGALIAHSPNTCETYGIRVELTCCVLIRGVRVSGFRRDGINVFGSQQIDFSGVRVFDNWQRGIAVVPKGEIDGPPDERVFSRCVTIRDSFLHDNGSTTAGANLIFGYGTGSCVVQDSRFSSTQQIRGVDGLTLDAASSGHVIERNEFYQNVFAGIKIDDGNGLDFKAVFQRDSRDEPITIVRNNKIGENHGAGVVIHNGCRNFHFYGNHIYNNSRGIDVIPGKVPHLDDLQYVRIMPGEDGDDFEYTTAEDPGAIGASVQANIFFYRNLIYKNRVEGIQIRIPEQGVCPPEGCDYVLNFRSKIKTIYDNIQVVSNTVVENGGTGVQVSRDLRWISAAGEEVFPPLDLAELPLVMRRIAVWYNILACNAQHAQTIPKASEPEPDRRFAQASLSHLIRIDNHFSFPEIFMDYNYYQRSHWQRCEMGGDHPGVAFVHYLSYQDCDADGEKELRQTIESEGGLVEPESDDTEPECKSIGSDLISVDRLKTIGLHGRPGSISDITKNPGKTRFASRSNENYSLRSSSPAVPPEDWAIIQSVVEDFIDIPRHVEFPTHSTPGGTTVPMASDIEYTHRATGDMRPAFGAYHRP